MKEYIGRRKNGVASVVVRDAGVERALKPRLDLRNHSPDGFEWGYGGSGPSQLALAILCDHLRDDKRAVALYQRFKFKTVARYPVSGFTLNSEQIGDHLAQIILERSEADGQHP